jgi:hypothetical protein
MLKTGNARNEMNKLVINGNVVTDPEQIEGEVNNFYEGLYNSRDNSSENESFLNDMFTVELNKGAEVSKPITLNELWSALKPLKDTAPGPDGITHNYLKKLWDIIGPLIVNAWNYSIRINKMPPSHYASYLKLIPKTGKDLSHLKNWRPITLSNCDHKLITRVCNDRLLTAVGDLITNTQTAYIKTRNITDNIRMINAAIQLANWEPQVSGVVIALDAQKAFDTVNHLYINRVMDRIGLNNFNPIFNLLYKDIKNNVLINGEIKGSHKITNGVKQGDALSCTLFILAIEPLIRNIKKNTDIKALRSLSLPYEWPKVYGYADDITCVMMNEQESKQKLFEEYEKFTKVSGLKLNADKTEIYEFGHNPNAQELRPCVKYLGIDYRITPVSEIKINGVYLCQNMGRMRELNINMLIEKMDRHFLQWSKRGLSLLGKIQIYKTFGLSQYLYHLSIFEPSVANWKTIHSRINKFLWNKAYTGNTAPCRIKKTILETEVQKGGFGMVEIKKVVTALRIRRHLWLLEYNVHPLHDLLHLLIDPGDYLCTKLELDIDEITQLNLLTLQAKRLKDYESPEWLLETDLILHASLIRTRLENLVRPRKLNGTELRELKRLGASTLQDVLTAPRHYFDKLAKNN